MVRISTHVGIICTFNISKPKSAPPEFTRNAESKKKNRKNGDNSTNLGIALPFSGSSMHFTNFSDL
jgi:hypothetical protein